MTALELNIFHFRCANGDIVSIPAFDERTARVIAMEQRWGPPTQNQTWKCDSWIGYGLIRVDEAGMIYA